MTLIDGKKIADDIKREIAAEVEEMVAQGKRRPHLAAILVGHDGGSETYVANKVKACEMCGFRSTLIRYEEEVTEEELLQAIEGLNNDDEVDGFIVQLPLPKLPQGCGRFPPHKCRQNVDRTPLLPFRNPVRDH